GAYDEYGDYRVLHTVPARRSSDLEEGAAVHILELNTDAAEEVAEAIRGFGGQAMVHSCDVSVQREVGEIITGIGAVDILVNNAGIAHVGNLEHTSEEDFDRIIRVNVKGAY